MISVLPRNILVRFEKHRYFIKTDLMKIQVHHTLFRGIHRAMETVIHSAPALGHGESLCILQENLSLKIFQR